MIGIAVYDGQRGVGYLACVINFSLGVGGALGFSQIARARGNAVKSVGD